ncbi:nucleolar DEAD-box protein required for synthesis of 60S ribosomal subunit [Naganishia vaughanmartiniae]|uniref:Nucleolar DEAD-box protein required for synthesis of 60S ribosomal subunit n=1 Tax=Naganishia vaughanmartiniae TaxID=1424756 RepID=A0ACC2X6B7_9TREE|nr:nucleolar DEAD-box protein required for synthesis of 60S ribosomal subunit [Naganishia vaughanmartiniae]
MSDFILTLDSDPEEDYAPGPSSKRKQTKKPNTAVQTPSKNNGDANAGGEDIALDDGFTFDVGGGMGINGRNLKDGVDFWGVEADEVKGGSGPLNVDDIIARRTGKPILSHKDRKRKREEVPEESDEDEEEVEEDSDAEMSLNDEDEADGFGMGVDSDLEEDSEKGSDAEEDVEMEGEDESEQEEDDDEVVEGEQKDEDDSDMDSDEDTAQEKARKDAFFSAESSLPASATNGEHDPSVPSSFAQMSLSRPLLRALTALGLNTPTPIQSKSIPLALLGRDILGSAVTGSGKTAAFMVPILERLNYREKNKAAIRVLVICPTRELAVQCFQVGTKLVEKGGMDIKLCEIVGGMSLAKQAKELRMLPDILIATPGRLIDHLNNTPSFTLSALDILVLDEADRMLEVGFEDELNEIIRQCPRKRQTMLFSATMTDKVDELVKLSLDRPVRIFVDPKRATAKNLIQEFVKVRERQSGGKGEDRTRAACLLALCKRTVKDNCIIFFRSKALAHQMRIVFGLCGLKSAELHGNLTQEQRLQALQDFKDGQVDYLLATDLASRGLDIKGVETVINYDMPGQLSAYTHRIGRTARAGRSGRAISLVGEADRKMLKAAIKQSPAEQVRHRVIPQDAIAKCADLLEELRDEVSEVLKEEKEEKALRQADMEVRKGQNMIEHEDEIFSRPARTWFQSETAKQAAKDAGKNAYAKAYPEKDAKTADPNKPKRGKFDGLSRQQARRKHARDLDEELGDQGNVKASIRAAKKATRPVKITEPLPKPSVKKRKTQSGSGNSSKKGGKKKSAFDTDGGSREGARAGKSDGVGLKKKGGKGKPAGKGSNKGMKGGKGGK